MIYLMQVKDIARDDDFMENLGLKETFSKLKLTDVEPTVCNHRYLMSRLSSSTCDVMYRRQRRHLYYGGQI
jgi:hypothetical protein